MEIQKLNIEIHRRKQGTKERSTFKPSDLSISLLKWSVKKTVCERAETRASGKIGHLFYESQIE